MVIWSLDCETYKCNGDGKYKPILDATGKHVICIGLVKENGERILFYNSESLWKHLVSEMQRYMKQNKKIHIYMHNATYDFYNIKGHIKPEIRTFCEKPFISGYYTKIKTVTSKEDFFKWKKYADKNGMRYEIINQNDDNMIFIKNKEGIKFIDSMNLFNGSLANMAKVIGMKKSEMPEELNISFKGENISQLGEYCLNDCEIILKFLEKLKEQIKKDGIRIRSFCTINQIAISYVMNKIRKNGNCEHIFQKGVNSEWFHKCRNKEDVHKAYKGGLVRVWKLGKIKGVTDIDCNSLYPYSITKINFPDLRTERKVKLPLKIYNKEDLFNKIGISRALVYNKEDELGLLPVRTNTRSYIPKKGKYMIGTWTHIELREALKNGYEIIDIEWSILWDKGENVLKPIYEELYEKRKKSDNKWENYYYKSLLNSSIGKFGQKRRKQEIFVDSIEMLEEYKKRKIDVIQGLSESTNMLYSEKGEIDYKKYYAPIISALVTAYSRVYMYNQFKKIPFNDLVYSDTDSCLFTGNHLDKFKIGDKMGEFKIEKDITTGEELINKEALIYGAKAKCIGNNLNVAGVFKSELNKEDFEKGILNTKRITGFKENGETGLIREGTRDLKVQKELYEEIEKAMNEEKLFIDYDIKNIIFFLDKLGGLT